MQEKHEEVIREKVLTVGVNMDKKGQIKIESSMAELAELAFAADAEVIESIVQNREKIDSRFYIGKGKAQEIAIYCDELDIDTVIFNDELSGSQIRNLQEVIDRKVVDRTNLILDIFAKRATAKEGKLQVELAQLKYHLPRLIGLGVQMSRTGAGIGTRGPGEKKLETDRRHILRRIYEIDKQLKELGNVRSIKRKKRLESALPIVALVGYTNAGKSTLLNSIIRDEATFNEDKEVFVYDMLFATLDTTLRKATLPNGQNFLLTDTVGFVSQLPTKLIEAFKGTLEEVKYADVLLHVVDVTNEDLEIQFKTTLKILEDLKVLDKPIITVFNKIDKNDINNVNYECDEPKIQISAKNGINLDSLLQLVQDNLPQKYFNVSLLIPYERSEISSYLFSKTKIESHEYDEKGTYIKTVLDEVDYNKFKKYIVE